jgi:hypothetical protein
MGERFILKMKKILLFSFFVITGGYCTSQPVTVSVHSEPYDALLKMVSEYFRSDPYKKEFSWFLNHLLNDPTLTAKTIEKRTDSNFFFFKGDYKTHSPYSFKADRTEIRLAETEFYLDDSLTVKDTMLVYQLLGYSYGGKTGMESVKKEFSKFSRRYGKHFLVQTSDIHKASEIVGAQKDFFVPGLPNSPFTAVWAKLDELQNVFIITIRLKVKEDNAQLPIPFYNH